MKTFICTVAVITAVSMFSSPLWAEEEQEEETVEAASDAENVDDDSESSEDAPKTKKAEKLFHILPFCRNLDGNAEVLRPGAKTWEAVREGLYYPLGASYRTQGKKTRLVVEFGKDVSVVIQGEASFGTRIQALGEQLRTITLSSGEILLKLPRNFPDGKFTVSAPGFKVVNMKGNSRYFYEKSPDGDGDTVTIRCVTGDLAVEGRHFKIASMKVANEIKIRTTLDQLFTALYGSRGDYIVRLDQGCRMFKDYATGESREEEKTLDWKLSPKTAVRIHRAVPALGEKLSVSVMTFDAAGELKNNCSFIENTYEVNTGEMGPSSKKEREDIAKKAAEATETVSSSSADEKNGDSAEETSDTSSESSTSDDDEF